MKSRFYGGIILVRFTITLLVTLTARTSFSFSGLYVYGDSLSDTGKIAASAPAYFNGRWSNGSVWVEYLSVKLGLAYNAANNYAYAGTTTSYLAAEVAITPTSTNLPSALCAVWSGGNDFLNHLSEGVYDDASWNSVITTAVSNITNAIGALYAKGARSVLVCNLPDLGKIPDVLNAYSSSYAAYVSTKVVTFNSALSNSLNSVTQAKPNLSLYRDDVYSRYAIILSAPASYGFTVSTIGALEDPALLDLSFTGPGHNYVFWDSIHPTTKTHGLIANWAFDLLPSPPPWIGCSRSGANLNLLLQNLIPGLNYTVQSSSNLLSWTAYQAFTAVGTNATIATTLGPASRLFYRLKREPSP